MKTKSFSAIPFFLTSAFLTAKGNAAISTGHYRSLDTQAGDGAFAAIQKLAPSTPYAVSLFYFNGTGKNQSKIDLSKWPNPSHPLGNTIKNGSAKTKHDTDRCAYGATIFKPSFLSLLGLCIGTLLLLRRNRV